MLRCESDVQMLHSHALLSHFILVFKIFNIEETHFDEKINLRVGKNINLNYSASDVVWNQNDGKSQHLNR